MSSPFDALTSIPCSITAGEATVWTESPADYPPTSYAIRYNFAGQTPQDGFKQFSILGVESGATYIFLFPVAISPGVYQWQKVITRTSDGQKATILQGQLVVRANLAIEPTITPAAAALATITTAIGLLAETADSSVSFNGQSFTKSSLAEYLQQQTRLQATVYKEQQQILALSGQARSRAVGVQFTPAQACAPGCFNR